MNSVQIAIWGNCNQQLVLNALINLKLWMSLEIFPHCGLGIVAHSPRAIAKYFTRQILNQSIKYYTVTIIPHLCHWRIGFQLSKDIHDYECDRCLATLIIMCFSATSALIYLIISGLMLYSCTTLNL